MFRIVFSRISYLLLTLLVACSHKADKSGLPYYNTPDFTPQFISSKNAVTEITHTIPDFSFTDQDNKTFSSKQLDGRIHVANFMFTSCGSICPVMTNHLKLVQDQFKNNNEVVILSFSVTPWMDSAARLKAYAEHNGITSSNWHLLTGPKNDIYNLARQSYFAEEDIGFSKDSSEFLHTEHILLVDKTRRIRGIYNGTLQLEVEQLSKDISRLLKD